MAADRVTLELDLTPGVAIAPAVLAMIDTDRNGDLSAAESDAYARSVIDGVALKVDGHPVQPRLERRQMPAWRDVKEGTGTIRLTASAALPALTEGPHQFFYANRHRSEIGVYLANALVPDDPRIEITGQRRDVAQHELTIDVFARAAPLTARSHDPGKGAAGLVMAVVFGVVFIRKMTARGRAKRTRAPYAFDAAAEPIRRDCA